MKGNGKGTWVVGGARPGLGAGWKRGYILPLCISMSSFLWFPLQSHITSWACSLSLSLNSLNKSLIIQLCPIYFLCFSSFLSFAVSSSCFGLLLDAVGACYRVVVVVVVPLPHPPSPQSCWARLIFSRPFRLLLLYAIIKRRGEKFVVVCMFWRRRWRRVSVLKNFPRQIHPVSFWNHSRPWTQVVFLKPFIEVGRVVQISKSSLLARTHSFGTITAVTVLVCNFMDEAFQSIAWP